MDTLAGVRTVVTVVENSSFTIAADKLGISKGLVSKQVSQIEAAHNIRLFNRNSRKISLTDAGANYYQHARKLLEYYEQMLDSVVTQQNTPSGKLRISSPIAFGEHVMTRLLPKFSQLYPQIKLELILQNQPVDMLKDGIDIRIKSGKVSDSNMIARPVCRWPLIVCASAKYLADKTLPTTPQQLAEHQCVLDKHLDDNTNWLFGCKDGGDITVAVNGVLASNNPQAVVNMIKAGGGIGLAARESVAAELQSGELVELLSDYQSKVLDIYLIYPHRQHIAQKTQCFIDFILSQDL